MIYKDIRSFHSRKKIDTENGRSTNHALLNIVEKIKEKLDKKKLFLWRLHWSWEGFWYCQSQNSGRKTRFNGIRGVTNGWFVRNRVLFWDQWWGDPPPMEGGHFGFWMRGAPLVRRFSRKSYARVQKKYIHENLVFFLC